MRYEIRPLGHWTDPVTDPRRGATAFRASWPDTLKLLERETEHLGATTVVIQVDADATDIRRDGMLRARARVGHPGVVVSFQSAHGPLRYATDAYEDAYWSTSLTGWQANVRAIALALEALRAVDRYGVTRRGEQYRGWAALPAGPAPAFTNADEALRWMKEKAHLPADTDPAKLYRTLARRYHPDAGGDPEDWARLSAAHELLDEAGLR
ncbi:hypothetical protein ACRYCC_26135 [Actinomadura scrupuli]|uniref:hypothetical protein n=1 Tax=Actinomadura scrupuli TaxID=559629 RepID=UPI003D998BE1